MDWLYEEDTNTVMATCPKCGGRLILHRYQYTNPYHYCPYCGVRLEEGQLQRKREEVYGKGH